MDMMKVARALEIKREILDEQKKAGLRQDVLEDIIFSMDNEEYIFFLGEVGKIQ